MTLAPIEYSSDQAEAYDRVTQMLRGAGIDLDDSLLTPPRGGKSQVMALIGKADRGKRCFWRS